MLQRTSDHSANVSQEVDETRGPTSKIYAPSSSAGTGTCDTAKKGKAFQLVKAIAAHCAVSVQEDVTAAKLTAHDTG